jgi:hypothetical protein
MSLFFRKHISAKKIFLTKTKLYLGQDPDLDLLETSIRLRTKIIRIRNAGYPVAPLYSVHGRTAGKNVHFISIRIPWISPLERAQHERYPSTITIKQ